MKKLLTISAAAAILGFGQQANAQVVIQNDTTFTTADQMLLANELFESGEPFAEALNYDLDLLDPATADQPDSMSYTMGIENYEYSRYLLNSLTGRSAMGLHMMWSPKVMANAAMQPASFDGMFTGGTANGYKEDDMMMMMIGNFSTNANQPAPMNAWPQFADFIEGNINLPQAVAPDYQMDFATTRWDRTKMEKTLNVGAMGQSMWKQYWWAQDMLSAFHDGNDEGIDATGTNSPDSVGSPNFDPNNDIYYGGNNLDGYIGQVLTAVSINKTALLINMLAYDGTTLGAVDPASYDPANGIKYFPTKIAVTESPVITGLPPQATAFNVTDENSELFDQISFLLATTSFKNMMNPNDNSDAAHLAYHEAFDGYPFPADMAATGTPGPFDLMTGASKVLFLNMMEMHYNGTEGTFVDQSSLDNSGAAVPGNVISAENAGYVLLALSKVSEEFATTPLQTMADNALIAQVDFILNSLKDPAGGYYNSFTIGTGASSAAKTLAAQSAIIRGLYAAYASTNTASYLTEANSAYNYLINNFYNTDEMVFKTEWDNNTAVYTPRNLAMLSGALREATLVGSQTEAAAIYTRVFKTVYNKMILAEGEATGESGSDSDNDGIPYVVGGTKPFVFAEKGVHQILATGINTIDAGVLDISVYPNPASSFVSVKMNMEQRADVSMALFDVTGRTVYSRSKISTSEGQQTITIPLQGIVAGNYILRTSMNNEPVSIEKLIVR